MLSSFFYYDIVGVFMFIIINKIIND